MPSLERLINEEVTMKVPAFADGPFKAKILAIETSGLWIESKQYTKDMLEALGLKIGPKTPILFVPYFQIVCIQDYLDTPSGLR